MIETAISHDGYPLILGVMGRSSRPELVAGFFGDEEEARVLVRDSVLEVRASGPVAEAAGVGFHWGAALEPTRTPSRWDEASESLAAAGIFGDSNRRVLFTDSLAIHDVFIRRQRGTVFFSTRLGPLLRLPGHLSMDPIGWASTLVFGAPIGPHTQFAEIERLGPAAGLAVTATGDVSSVSYSPSWTTVTDHVQVEDLVDAVRAAVPVNGVLRRPPPVTLSGGWDSRLLSGLAVQKSLRPPRGWTVEQDDGFELDVAYAPAVARRLRMPHRIVRQPSSGWPALAQEARARLEFTTWMHTWLVPLCRRMHREESEVIDGLAGDILLQGRYVDEELLALPTPRDRLTALFPRYGGDPGRFERRIDPGVAGALIEACREEFFAAVDEFDDHINHLDIAKLVTRTARVIARSPLGLFSPELQVWLPFLDPTVMRLALSIDPHEKSSARLYRKVLALAVPEVADLPSTNDGDPRPERGPRLHAQVDSIKWMVDSILASDVAASLLAPSFRDEIRTEDGLRRASDQQTGVLLQALALLASWEAAHPNVAIEANPWS